MKSNNDSFQVSIKSIIVLVLIISGFIASFFLFDNISEKRKFNQFIELNTKTTNSIHLEKLKELTARFDLNDTVVVSYLDEQLGLLREDVNEINSCELLIPISDGFVKINGYDTKYEKVNTLPFDERQVIELLDMNKQKGLVEQIYKITKSDHLFWTMIKVENCYLKTSRYMR